jgi:hypothetical protein
MRRQAADVAALRAGLGAAMPAEWDELYLLRFYCLSFRL